MVSVDVKVKKNGRHLCIRVKKIQLKFKLTLEEVAKQSFQMFCQVMV